MISKYLHLTSFNHATKSLIIISNKISHGFPFGVAPTVTPSQALLQGAQSGELWTLLQGHASQRAAQSELLKVPMNPRWGSIAESCARLLKLA